MQDKPSYPRRWWALVLLCAAQFLVMVDTAIIGIALPTIGRDLGLRQPGLQWVFNAYVIAFGGLLLLGGRLGDLFGRRRIFVVGFAVFTAASLFAGLAPSGGALIAARALQGVGAAIISPVTLSIILNLFADPGERTRALGVWGASAAAGGTAGVLLGGVLTGWLSWHWVFFINLPAGALALALSPALLRPDRDGRERGSLDLAGALSITVALALAVYAVVTADETGWATARTLGLIAVSLALLAVFVTVERRKASPLVPLGIFRSPNLSGGNLLAALIGASWTPTWFFINLYLQQVLGYSPVEGGLAFLPMTALTAVLMAGGTSPLVARFGIKPSIVAGLTLLGGAMLLFALAPTDGSYALHVLPASLVAAFGMTLAYVPATLAATSGAPPEGAGLASGLVNTSFQVGSALGLAAMTTVATAHTAARLAGSAAEPTALNAGFHAAFVGAAALAGGGALLAVAWLRKPGASPAGPQPAKQQ